MEIFNYMPKEGINEHYYQRYIKFIVAIYNKGSRQLDYSEKHHIIPICINKAIEKNASNLIELTAREHFIAHILLSKCFIGGTNEYNRLICALFAMAKLKMKYHQRSDIHMTSKQYERIRSEYAAARSEFMKSEAGKDKYKNWTTKGIPSVNKGKICITNGSINKYIDKEKEIPEGWHRGSTQQSKPAGWRDSLKSSWKKSRDKRVGENHPNFGKKIKPMTKGYKRINNGSINKSVPASELESYLNNGWELGMTLENKNKSKGKRMMFKGDNVIAVEKADISKYELNGWKLGNPKAARKGSQNGSYNKILINNGTIRKRVEKKDLEQYLANGWKRGYNL